MKEATISTLILVLLVAFPSHLSFMNYFKDDSDYLPLRRSRGAISWNYVRYKVPWRIIFMMGGGLTLAEGSRVTQMSYSLADYIYTFDRFPKFFLLFILCFPVFLLTQVFGNVPLAYIILPVIKDLVGGEKECGGNELITFYSFAGRMSRDSPNLLYDSNRSNVQFITDHCCGCQCQYFSCGIRQYTRS